MLRVIVLATLLMHIFLRLEKQHEKFLQILMPVNTTLTVDLATRKRARRGDIHKALGLPGWFLGDAPSTSSVAVPAAPVVPEKQGGKLEETAVEQPAEPDQARPV